MNDKANKWLLSEEHEDNYWARKGYPDWRCKMKLKRLINFIPSETTDKLC